MEFVIGLAAFAWVLIALMVFFIMGVIIEVWRNHGRKRGLTALAMFSALGANGAAYVAFIEGVFPFIIPALMFVIIILLFIIRVRQEKTARKAGQQP